MIEIKNLITVVFDIIEGVFLKKNININPLMDKEMPEAILRSPII